MIELSATVARALELLSAQGMSAKSLQAYTHNVPLVEQEADAICIAGNTVDRQPQNGGNGLGCQDELAYTLTATDRLSGYPDKRSNPED